MHTPFKLIQIQNKAPSERERAFFFGRCPLDIKSSVICARSVKEPQHPPILWMPELLGCLYLGRSMLHHDVLSGKVLWAPSDGHLTSHCSVDYKILRRYNVPMQLVKFILISVSLSLLLLKTFPWDNQGNLNIESVADGSKVWLMC